MRSEQGLLERDVYKQAYKFVKGTGFAPFPSKKRSIELAR
ncbi:hypothetical protein HMPREF1376_00081 [Enterococcus faecium R446]|nr:hypothetical protein HMPREF1376_00081 [Enterococcus faecium R446]